MTNQLSVIFNDENSTGSRQYVVIKLIKVRINIKLNNSPNCRNAETQAAVYVNVTSLVAYTRRTKANQYICSINSVKNNRMLKNSIAPANGPSFLNQNTVLELW